MKIFHYEMSENIVNFLERLEDEVHGYMNVITSILSSDLDNVDILDSKPFVDYDKIYQEKVAKHEIAKKYVTTNFIPHYLIDNGISYSWSLEYKSCKFSIVVYSDLCDNMTEEELLHA